MVLASSVRLDVEIKILGSRRFSISRDIIVTDILQAKDQWIQFEQEMVQYTYSRRSMPHPLIREQPTATNQQKKLRKGINGTIGERTKKVNILPKFAAVIILPQFFEH